MTPYEECNRGDLEKGLVPTHKRGAVSCPEKAPLKAWMTNEVSSRSESINYEEKLRLISRQGSRRSEQLSTKSSNLDFRNTSRLQKIRKIKKKIFGVIKPPYFITFMLLVLACFYWLTPKEVQVWLEWLPGAWWREPWRLLTYGMVHASLAHYALNALVALAVGWRLEHEQSWWRVLVVWMGGVAAGALGAGALQPTVRVVGSSAAVYALLTAHLPNVCLRFGNIPLWWFRPLSVVVLVASEAFWALIRSSATQESLIHAQQQEPVAWSAHLLGAAIGVPLGFVIFKADDENYSKFYIRICRIVSIVLLVSAVASSIIFYLLISDTTQVQFSTKSKLLAEIGN
ncbi:rhomboid-related protein 1 [Aphomia sociella]